MKLNYQLLRHLGAIFQDKFFYYMSSEKEIKEIAKKIKFRTHSENLESYKKKLSGYEWSLEKVYEKFFVKARISDIDEGRRCVKKTLKSCMTLVDHPERKKLSSRRMSKFSNQFLYGLKKFFKGIVTLFKNGLVFRLKNEKNRSTASRIVKRFILDDYVGLGRKFSFNAQKQPYGFKAILESCNDFAKLIRIVKLLNLNKGRRQGVSKDKWWDLGASKDPIRILCAPRKIFQKMKVYYLYIDRHREYEKQLRKPIKEAVFVTA